MTPAVPNSRPDTIPVSVACTVWQMLTVSSSGLTQRSGSLTSRTSALPDF
jgi:hypothetical protein